MKSVKEGASISR